MCTESRVYDNILEVIGNTPMVKLHRVARDHGLECEFFAKCEFLNPGGSIKDRISYEMIRQAIKDGQANPQTRFVEPTSGNTGIGVAMTTAVLGHSATIVTPDKNSDEKMNTMRLLGTDIVQTPAAAFFGSPENFLAVTQRILDEVPNTHSCDQYKNPVNPDTHYKNTATEILTQVPDVTMVVIGAGTGGTVAGISRKIKEVHPSCTVVAVDPVGSTMFGNGEPKVFFVEGIGGDFIPDVLDKRHIDAIEKVNDKQSFNMAREVIKKEGLLCGGSSGAAMYAAIQAAKKRGLKSNDKVVVILPDGIRNYMTKFVTDQWMESHLFMKPATRKFEWYNHSLSDLPLNEDVPKVFDFQSGREAYYAMGSDHNVAFVVNKEGYLKGVVSKDSLRFKATNPLKEEGANFDDQVIKFVMKNYHKIIKNGCITDCTGAPTVGLASRILDIAPFVVIVEAVNMGDMVPKGIITPDIVLEFIMLNQPRH